MIELSGKNFGLVIAYVLPGFVALWGASYFSPTVEAWLLAPPAAAPGMAGFCYGLLGSVAAGLTVSAVRWALIDTFHHATGISPPAWEFARLDQHLGSFLALVENHYRYYQFYANMFVAVAFAYRASLLSEGLSLWAGGWVSIWFLVLEAVLFAGSRDSLTKYYARAGRLLRA